MAGTFLKGPKLNAPSNLTLGQLFFDLATKFHDRTCQIDVKTNQHESFSSVQLRSKRVALGMQKLGITSEDVVLTCSSVTLDTPIAVLASFFLAAKLGNLDRNLSVRQTTHLLSLVVPKMIFVEESALSLIEKSLERANHNTIIVVLGKSSQYLTFSDLDKPQVGEEEFKPVVVDVHDAGLLFFSSGTTGLPKAICHSHYSFINAAYAVYQVNQNFETTLFYTSFYWMSGMLLLTCPFIEGGRRLVCVTMQAEETFQIIEKYKVTYIFLAPILTYKLTNFPKHQDFDVSSVHIILTGGTPLSSSQLSKLSAVFQHSNIIFCYGLTEAAIISLFNPLTDKELIQNKIGSCGKMIAGITIKVVDTETNEVLGPRQQGEILVKTPSLMKGYKNDTSQIFDDGGFLKTGDKGYYDEDNCLYFVGRIKEMFKYMSWHIVPASIEKVLQEHEAVAESVVFGIPVNEEVGEVPAACVVLKNGSTVSGTEIEEFVASQVTDGEKLRGGVFFREKLLRTSTSKVMRKEIRESVLQSLHSRNNI